MKFIERIPPSKQNVLRFQNVLLDDYTRIGVPEGDAEQMVFGEDGTAGSELLHAMANGPKRYQALSAEGSLAAVASVDDWNYGNMKPFVSTKDYIELRFLHKVAEIRGDRPTTHDGLFSFGVSNKYDYAQAANMLLDNVLEGVAERDKEGIRAAIDTDDIGLLDIFETRGRRIQQKVGRVVVRGVVRNYHLYEIDAPSG